MTAEPDAAFGFRKDAGEISGNLWNRDFPPSFAVPEGQEGGNPVVAILPAR